MQYLLVALGSALGGVARYACTVALGRRLGEGFPWGTILVNVVGSLLIGIALAVLAADGRWSLPLAVRDQVNLFFVVGVLGGFTTFSAFSMQTLVLIRDQQFALAGINVGLSVVACVSAAAVGYWAALK